MHINWSDLTIDNDKLLFRKYETFVHYSLYVCEQLLELKLGNEWTLAVDGTLKAHEGFLTSEHFVKSGEISFYTRPLRDALVRLYPQLKPARNNG